VEDLSVPATAKRIPVGFLSYAHADDDADSGRLTEFRIRLEREIRVQTGTVFSIFQDRQDIRWGDAWRQRIESSIDTVTFLIPIITPSFFLSSQCRAEFDRFLDREKKLDRNDLIFPMYYVNCRFLEESDTSNDPLARIISGRQYVDWRELRFDNLDSPRVARSIAELARQLGEAALREDLSPRVVGEGATSSPPEVTEFATSVSLTDLPSISDISKGTGLIGIFPGFDECQAEILREVRESQSVKIFVQMGKSVLSGAAILYEALERTRKDAEVKILHAGVENPYLSERVALNRESNYKEWREDINYVIRIGGRLQGRLGARLELRKHSEGYVWRFFLFDNYAYLQPYLFPRDNARRAPVLKFARLDSSSPTGNEVNANSLHHMLENYFDLKWEECAPEATRLSDMITLGDPTAVAALVKRAGAWVFVVPKRFVAVLGEELPFHSIGGKRNANESWLDALQREATEEIGTQLQIKASPFTRDITTSAEFEHLALSDDPRPYCVYKRTREIDPEVVEPEVLWIVGFEAELQANVAIEPQAEIAAVVMLSANMLRRTARERITYDQIRRAKDGSSVTVQAGIEFDFQRVAVPAGLAALPTFEIEMTGRSR
jgi:8-oxo-dGTP pyrophosphatase MutT (NUDIX family)